MTTRQGIDEATHAELVRRKEPSHPDDILWRESFKQARASVIERIGRVERSLMSLKNQTSGYAESHRKLIAMYKDVLATIDRHQS